VGHGSADRGQHHRCQRRRWRERNGHDHHRAVDYDRAANHDRSDHHDDRGTDHYDRGTDHYDRGTDHHNGPATADDDCDNGTSAASADSCTGTTEWMPPVL
jgi:hypothetical protein